MSTVDVLRIPEGSYVLPPREVCFPGDSRSSSPEEVFPKRERESSCPPKREVRAVLSERETDGERSSFPGERGMKFYFKN